MKWEAMLVLFHLSIGVLVADAQSPAERPMPEVATFVRQTIQQQRFAESREQDYVFREDVGSNKLRKECTWAPKCPAPAGVPGVIAVAYYVLRSTERSLEIFWLDGIRVARILPNNYYVGTRTDGTDNIRVPTSELAIENQRVDREVAEAKALRAQGADATFPDDPPQMLFSRMLELCTFSNPRRQVLEAAQRFCSIMLGILLKSRQAQTNHLSSHSQERFGLTRRITQFGRWKANFWPM